MNDETMNKDKWETFCDESYFHMWRLRRIGLHGFDDGFHINRRDEAIGLCGLLNKLEHELANMEDQRDAAIWCHEKCREDRLRVIGQCDRLAKEVENLRAAQIHTCHDQCQKPMCVMRRQRDRLAEALESLMYGHEVMGEWERCEQALAAAKGGSHE
jgi:hypothetical protein